MPLPEKLQAARLLASEKWPYVSSALWAITPVESKGLGTLGVDKWWRLYYDPDVPWTVEECATVFYHEVQHLIRKHPERAEMQAGIDQRAWNVAGDCEINDDIVQERWHRLPDGVLQPGQFGQPAGLLAEEYYERMPVAPMMSTRDCGSIAGGPKRDHEQDGPKTAGGMGEAPGLTEAEAELVRHQIANDVKSSSRGDVPEYMKKWAKEILEPTVDWRKALRGQIRRCYAEQAGQVDYTWKRLSRRQGVTKRVVVPALIAPVPRVAVIADTSGSMDSSASAAVLAEIGGILKALGTSARVYSVDAVVHNAKRVFRASQVELIGGGGTDMGAGIGAAMKDKPHIIVVLTDGYTPWPNAPATRVVVALVNENDQVKAPDWARTVRVRVDR